MDRRDFLRSSLYAGSLAALGTAVAPAASAASSPKSPEDPQHIRHTVILMGDDVPRYGRDALARMDAILQTRDKAGDVYLKRGAVEELEQRFAQLLGKEDAAFMPTGTLANQVALRLLCGEKRRALVQQESHVYCDESDAVTTLSEINLVPLAPGRAAPTLDEVDAAIAVSEKAAYPLPIGAISLESPVRRADGAMVPLETVKAIAERARAKGIGMHLDGARLLLNSGAEGFAAEAYAAPFDTVYVSLYKYLGAPFGAILAGTKATVAKARDTRHIFGGTIFHGWQAALLALDGLDGFAARFAKVREAGDRLLEGLAKVDGYAVRRVEHGTNIHFLQIAEERRQGLRERLEKAGVMIAEPRDGRLALTFNETLLRKPADAIVKAFAA
ncbi:beta-eliminating lyase-related protein [Dyella sp. BiH032]|uniref:threonine aldolase family protein n=1 Tax=Dyella sp. BiH032 TaxID=3075430 RepID=UPI0028933007|nr:aminotransferase class I/II-fold pyridoxal phosphate-dependent enzyme [Dyella sp. BiH032]WNL45413.1 beta-eliminating lyase-related protein [Dyella sp. BiH032]